MIVSAWFYEHPYCTDRYITSSDKCTCCKKLLQNSLNVNVARRTLRVLVAEGGGPHVTQPDGALAAAVDEGVALVGVELCGGDHLRQLLHVGGLYVNNV